MTKRLSYVTMTVLAVACLMFTFHIRTVHQALTTIREGNDRTVTALTSLINATQKEPFEDILYNKEPFRQRPRRQARRCVDTITLTDGTDLRFVNETAISDPSVKPQTTNHQTCFLSNIGVIVQSSVIQTNASGFLVGLTEEAVEFYPYTQIKTISFVPAQR